MDALKGIGSGRRYYDSERRIKRRKNHILAIGIGEYQDFSRLYFPVQECKRLIEILIKNYDFEPEPRKTLFDLEATCDAIYTELYNLDDLSENDNLVLIFSGHGFYDKLKDNGYWVPVDGQKLTQQNGRIDNPSVLKHFISISDIVDNLNTVKAHHIILIVDSCFAGKFTRFNLQSPLGAYNEENMPAEELPSRWALTSGLIEKVPDESLFARALLNVLDNPPDKKLTIYSLFAKIEDKIEQSGPYSPSLYPIVEANRRGGKFALYRREDSLSAGIEINLASLAEGSLDFLHQLEAGRFKILTISDLLLPQLQNKWLDTKVEAGDKKENFPLRMAIEEFRKQDNTHAILFGSGGMGKTVSFIRLWQQWREQQEGPIPIFIALNEYNTYPEAEREHFIFRYIHRNYLPNAVFSETIIESLWTLITDCPNDVPDFIFLLDGFNEVTADKMLLIQEMEELISRAKNLQILVASRQDLNVESFNWARRFNRVSFKPIELSRIEQYLKGVGIEELPKTNRLLELLGNPMMLTLYAGTSEWEKRSRQVPGFEVFFKPKISSSGELLWNFVEAQLAKLAEDNPANHSNLIWKSFLLRHLLPYLGFRMAESGQFQFLTREKRNSKVSFTEVVNDGYDWLEKNNFFSRYPSYESSRNLLKVGLNKDDIAALEARSRDIRLELVDNLHFLVRERSSLRFIHQNFRDYFAAVHIQKSLEFTIAQNQGLELTKRKFPIEIQQAPLDLYIRRILGELEGEHDYRLSSLREGNQKSKAFLMPANFLGQLFEQCRGVFDEKQLGYTLWNIITIWKEQHSAQLAGADLRQLNLKGQFLYNTRLSEMQAESSLSFSILENENFFLLGHRGKITKAILSPDAQKIVTVSSDGTCKIWDARTSKLLQTLEEHNQPLYYLDLSADGARIATGSYYGIIQVWDISAGLCLQTIETSQGKLSSLKFSLDNRSIYTTTDKGIAQWWNIESGALILQQQPEVPKEEWETLSIKFDPKGEHVLTNYRGTIELWDFQSGRRVRTFEPLDSSTKIGEFNRDGTSIIVWDYKRAAFIDLDSTELRGPVLIGHSEPINTACFSPNGKRILTSAKDSVKLWDRGSGQCILTLDNTKYNKGATFSTDGKLILTSGSSTRIWDAENGNCLFVLSGSGTERSSIQSIRFSPDQRNVFLTSWDGVEVWNIQAQRCISKKKGNSPAGPYLSEVDSSGKRLLSSQAENAYLTNLSTGVSKSLIGHSRLILSLAINHDGSLVATGAWDKVAKIWESKTGQCLFTLSGNKKKMTSLAFSPDGKLLATAASMSDAIAKPNRPGNWIIIIWEVKTGKKVVTLKGANVIEKLLGRFVDKKLNQGHSATITATHFSPDSRLIGTGSDDNTGKIWEIKTGRLLSTLKGHADSVKSIRFSPDGQQVASCSADKTVRIWKVRTGTCMMTLEGHTGKVNCIDYDHTGQRIISGSSSGEIKLWDTKSGQCLSTFYSYRGLLVQGCDFRDLHPHSNLSDQTIEILKSHGGIFSDEEAQLWEAMKQDNT